MSIKINQIDKIFDCDFKIINWRSIVRLAGEDLPKEAYDYFEVVEQQGEELVILDYFEDFNIIYDQGDGYIEFTNDTSVYYNYLIADAAGFVQSVAVTTDSSNKDGYLYQSGRGKKYKEPNIKLFDDNAPLYIIKNGELFNTTEEEKTEYILNSYENQLQKAKEDKKKEISEICSELIVKGVEINGEYFSYNLDDQNNILNNLTMAMKTGMDIPYHANGKPCRLFTLNEIISIYVSEEHNLTHNVTYNNQLKLYVNTLNSIEEVEAIKYGDELVGEYLNTYNLIMAQSDALIQAFTTQTIGL